MKIGIDVSQLAYPNTGVANYLKNLVSHLIAQDTKNEYILFASSLRRKEILKKELLEFASKPNVSIKLVSFPPSFLDFVWNRLHVFPIEYVLGKIDVFISSDWTQPPSNAKKVTILYDLIVYTYPNETSQKIVDVQKRKLAWVKKEIDKIICISKSSKEDAKKILGIPEEKLEVIYPGF